MNRSKVCAPITLLLLFGTTLPAFADDTNSSQINDSNGTTTNTSPTPTPTPSPSPTPTVTNASQNGTVQTTVTTDDAAKARSAAAGQARRSPTATYMAYLQTLRSTKSLDTLRPFFTDAIPFKGSMCSLLAAYCYAPELPPNGKRPDPYNVLLMGKFGEEGLDGAKVTSEKITGTTATLQISTSVHAPRLTPAETKILISQDPVMAKMSTANTTTKSSGTVVLKLVGNDWLIDQQSWSLTGANGMSATMGNMPEGPTKRNAFCAAGMTAPFSTKPVHGKLHGQPFTPDRVDFNAFMKDLSFEQGGTQFSPDRKVQMSVNKPPEELEGKQLSSGTFGLQAWMFWKDDTPKAKNSMSSMDQWGGRIQFGKITNYMLPGYIIVRFPDKEQSYLEGYFYAKITK